MYGMAFDPRKLMIYVEERMVWKGYDFVILPPNQYVDVEPGKYMLIRDLGDGKILVGFEEDTVEANESPDYDFDEPRCIVTPEKGLFTNTYKLVCDYSGTKTVQLWYGDRRLYTFACTILGCPEGVEITITEPAPGRILVPASIALAGVGLAVALSPRFRSTIEELARRGFAGARAVTERLRRR